MTEIFTDNHKKYITLLIQWGNSQLGRGNPTQLPPIDNLDEDIKEFIKSTYPEISNQTGKKKKTKHYRVSRKKKSKKINKNK